MSIDERGRVVRLRVGGRNVLKRGAVGGFFIADVEGIPARETELLDNPSFERLSNGKPLGWSVGRDWSVDRTVAHSGRISMKVSIIGKRRSSGSLAIEVPVKPNTPYRVSMWLRTAGGAPHFYIVQLDASGKTHRAYPQICVSHARRHSDWFQLSRSFTTAFFCRKIRVYTSLWQQTGTAWVDDVSIVCLDDDYVTPQAIVLGTTRASNGVIEQTCNLADMLLRFNARYRTMRNCIVVDGELKDTSGRDRAIAISFRLPIDALGWTWFDDIHNAQVIEDGIRYGAVRLFGERRTIALYPFAAMGDGDVALAIAIPMDMPRVFRICYDRKVGYFVNYEFGLSRETAKFPSSAWFKFVIYRIDSKWGFRAAAKRYYELFPQFFTKRVVREGPAGFMASREQIESPNFIPPAFAIFSYRHRDALPAHRRKLVKLFAYTEFSGWWGWALGITPERAKVKPSPEEAWSYVERLAFKKIQDAPEGRVRVAQCILNCVPYDRDGKRRLHTAYVAKWGGYNYLCNPDPEIEGIGGKVNRYTLTREREVKQVEAFKLDGLYFDCVFVFAVDNFRRDHFRWVDNPLAFDHVSKKPVMPMAFSIYECAKAFADEMHSRGKLVMSNYSVTNHPTDMFCIQFIDIIGNEMLWTWTTDAKFALQRTLAYQKTVSMSWQEAKKDWARERIERELKQAMFYGTFYYLSTMGWELYKKWVPLTQCLASAGWEPITHAWVDDAGVMIERFGNIKGRNLHFTMRNETSQPKAVIVTIDADALGLDITPHPDVWLMCDSQRCERLDVKRKGARWYLQVTIPPNDTVVLRVATKSDVMLDHTAEVAESSGNGR